MELSAWRKARGLTQTRFAKMAGLTGSLISRIESGSKIPGRETARRIEAATKGDVSAASLLGLRPEKKRRSSLREETEPFTPEQAVVSVEIPINPQVLAELRACGVDVEAVARDGALRALKEATAAAWREANKDVIEQNRRYIEKHGTFAEQMGLI